MIVLLTDYGTRDPFVGMIKGVLGTIAPEITQVDLTHGIPPGDVRRGAIVLWQALSYFPPGSVFLAVVDPGVGTWRKPILVRTGQAIFIGPDNGLFSFITQLEYQAWEISNPEFMLPVIGATFHGRDIFAPAAAHVAIGVPPNRLGDPIHKITFLPPPKLAVSGPSMKGETLFSDGFGNILTSFGKFSQLKSHGYLFEPWLSMDPSNDLLTHWTLKDAHLVLPTGEGLPWVKTFSDVPEGTCAFLVGGSGLLEVISNRASAAGLLHLSESSALTLLTGGR